MINKKINFIFYKGDTDMHRILEGITRCLRIVLKNVFLNKISGAYIVPERVRRVLYRLFGMKIGKARIKPNCFLKVIV